MDSFSFTSKNEEQTVFFAKCLAEICDIGDVILLNGTLGMGKSVFARGFIKHLCGEDENVPSPTFTLVQLYDFEHKTDGLTSIWHFDLYRIKQSEEVLSLGIDDAFAEGVSLIEWPERLGVYTPFNRLEIEITPAENSKNYRTINVKSNGITWNNRLELLEKLVSGNK
jgi:tRNA threonylcarbamoyladenosine biosynthesis protein TsaE